MHIIHEKAEPRSLKNAAKTLISEVTLKGKLNVISRQFEIKN